MADTGIGKISKAVLDKVDAEAQQIIDKAEQEARDELAKAEKRRNALVEDKKRKMIQDAQAEASRILARASIKARREMLLAKAGVIDEVIDKVKNAIGKSSINEKGLLGLIKEAVSGVDAAKLRLYVSSKDIDKVRNIVSTDKDLAKKVEEIKEIECSGGVMAEDIDGKVRIDNSYESRLEILLPRLIPDVSKELFGDL